MSRRRGSGVRRRADATNDVLVEEIAEASRVYAGALTTKLEVLTDAIRRVREERDESAVIVARSLAHRLRGTSGCYGFSEMKEPAGVIEDALWAAFETNEDWIWERIDRALLQLITLNSAIQRRSGTTRRSRA